MPAPIWPAVSRTWCTPCTKCWVILHTVWGYQCQCFESDNHINATVVHWFQYRFLVERIHQLVRQQDACLNAHENYFYKPLLLFPEQSPNGFHLNIFSVVQDSCCFYHRPMVYDLPFGLCTGKGMGFVILHSYHTLFLLHNLQKCTSNSSPLRSCKGSRMGKKIGNQLNIPLECVSGTILRFIFLYKTVSK